MDVSIIIVNYRTSHLCAQLLSGLRQTPPRSACEIIVVNNGSEGAFLASDGYHLPLTVETLPENLGLASATNAGFAKAKGELILLLNPDVLIEGKAIDALAEVMRGHPETGIAAPMLLGTDGKRQASTRRFYDWWSIVLRRTPLGRIFRSAVGRHLMADIEAGQACEVDWALGAALMVRRSLADGGRLMDERFFLYMEDVDLCAQCCLKGLKVRYSPEATMVHAHAQSSRRSIFSRANLYHLISLFRFWRKYGSLNPVKGVCGR